MADHAYPDGIDCVWIASDGNGHVGAFVTAGEGPIPVQALRNEQIDIKDVEEAVCQLPQVTSARLLVQIKRPDDFIAMAERGLFVYDWRDVHRPVRKSKDAYEPVAVPLTPITSDALPETLAILAANVVLHNWEFIAGEPLDICSLMECRNNEY